MKLGNRFLNLCFTPLRLIVGNQFLLHSNEFVLTLHGFNGKILIVFGNLFSQIAATSMNHEVFYPFGISINLDEVVSTTERTDGANQSFRVFECLIAPNVFNYLGRVDSRLVYFTTAWDVLTDSLVEIIEVNVNLTQFHGQHTATNVNANDVRNDLIPQISRKANDTTSPGVNVRHDTDFAI